jgi:hypothetical protein
MQYGAYIRKDYRRIPNQTRRIEDMRLTSADESKIVVLVKTAKRDAKTGKMVYGTEESFNVFDAKPEEVIGVVKAALTNASKK